MGMLTLSKYVVHEVIFIYYPMTEDSSSEVPSASNSASVLERRSPPYVLVNPVKILHIHIWVVNITIIVQLHLQMTHFS